MHHVLAYIDPGAGSLLIQALVAAALAVPFFFRRTVASVFARFKGVKDNISSESQAPDPDA